MKKNINVEKFQISCWNPRLPTASKLGDIHLTEKKDSKKINGIFKITNWVLPSEMGKKRNQNKF